MLGRRLALYALGMLAATAIIATHGLTSVVVAAPPTPRVFPVWTDTEIHAEGQGIILRCSYHRADGTTHIVDTLFRTQTCPPPP